MKCIKILTDEDFGMTNLPVENPRERIAARGLVFNNENKIAILNKKFKNEYKLVGGGIENDEEPSIAFQREVLEETGCNINIDNCLGIIILLITIIVNKINNKITSSIRTYINNSEQKDREISAKNDLIMKEKREKALNTSYVKCPTCGADNIISSKIGKCKYCRSTLSSKIN